MANNDKVISIEELPWAASTKFLRECLKDYDEQERAKNGALVQANLNIKWLTQLTIHSDAAICTIVQSLDKADYPFFYP